MSQPPLNYFSYLTLLDPVNMMWSNGIGLRAVTPEFLDSPSSLAYYTALVKIVPNYAPKLPCQFPSIIFPLTQWYGGYC